MRENELFNMKQAMTMGNRLTRESVKQTILVVVWMQQLPHVNYLG